jgi:hypothetical protein
MVGWWKIQNLTEVILTLVNTVAASSAIVTVDSDDSPDGIPIKNRTRFRELTGRDSDLIPDSFST